MNKKLIFITTIIFIFIAGCAGLEKSHIQQAGSFAEKSRVFYQKAEEEYKKALETSKQPENIYFKLGLLYYQHGDYQKAIAVLTAVDFLEAKKLLAYSYYKSNNFTDALSIFNKLGDLQDEEYLFCYGLTSEKLNLFEQAKNIYEKIKSPEYALLAETRLNSIDSLIQKDNIKALDPVIYEIIKSSPSQEDYPQASALILLSDERFEVSQDNTAVFDEHYLVKILNERGKEFGEIEIGYDSTYEKAELIYARTIKPDGAVVQVGDKHIRDVSKYLNFPLYSNARALIISMPEVVTGSIIEYKVKINRSRLVNKKDFDFGYLLQNSEPIISSKFTLSLPKERTLNTLIVNEGFNYFNAELSPKITEQDNKRIYSWEFKDIPEVIPEPEMPPTSEIVTAFLLSTFNSWDEIYKWWWDLAKDKISANDEIKKLVAQLIEDKETKLKKAQAIYNWCTENIRYVAVEYGQAGHEPHSAEDIFKNKYGDCKDQAILLISMLKEAGLDAYPVLIGTKGIFNLNESFPALLFNHCIACVKIDNDLIFLDPTGETVSFGDLPAGDQDRKVLVFFEDKVQILTTPLFVPEHNRTETKTAITLNQDESILVDRQVITYGVYNQAQRWWLKYTKPVLIEETLREKAHSVSPGAELIDYKIDNLDDPQAPIKLSYNFKGPEYLVKAGKARIIPQLGDINLSMVAKDKRNYAIDFGILEENREILEFNIPANFTVKFMPESINRSTKWFDFTNQYDFDNGKITFTQNKIVKAEYVDKEEYKDFKKLLEEISRQINQCIVLEEASFQ